MKLVFEKRPGGISWREKNRQMTRDDLETVEVHRTTPIHNCGEFLGGLKLKHDTIPLGYLFWKKRLYGKLMYIYHPITGGQYDVNTIDNHLIDAVNNAMYERSERLSQAAPMCSRCDCGCWYGED
jgi:hypothetical protein